MSKEIWSKVDEGGFYDGLYEVSNFGRWKMLPRILKTKEGKGWRKTKEKITFGNHSKGYMKVQMKKDRIIKQVDLHILVARAFIPNPDNLPCVNHLYGNKADNRAEFLEWSTIEDNNKHAWRLGLIKATKGEERSTSKLNDDKVRQIRALYKTDKYSMRKLASMFGVCQTTILKILDRDKWSHVK